MKHSSPSLAFFRTPSLWRELLVVVQVALTLLMPSRKAHAILYKDFLRREIGTKKPAISDWLLIGIGDYAFGVFGPLSGSLGWAM